MQTSPNHTTVTSPESRNSRGILTALFLGVLMAALDIAILGPAMPSIREAFGIDERLGSWIFTVWVFSNLMGVPVMSKLADLFGRKSLYLFNIGLFAIGGAVVAVSPSFTVLLAGRALQGLAVSGIFPVAGAVIGESIEPERRGRAFGVLGSVFGVAFIIGPITAGMMLMLGWRWLYLIFVPIAAVVILLGRKTLPVTERPEPKPFDYPGLFLLAGLLLAVAYGVSMFDTSEGAVGIEDPRVWVSLLLAAVLIPVFLAAERRAVDPVLRLNLFRNKQVKLAALLAAGAGVNEAAFIFFPTICVIAFDVSSSQASFMLLPLMISVAVASPVAGRILDKTGSKAVILASNALLALGMLGIASSPESKAVFYVSSVLIGAGLAGLMGSALSYILLHESRKEERSVSQGIITLFISMGQLLAGAAVGATAASSSTDLEGYRTAFLGIAVMTMLLTVVSFLLKNRSDEQIVVHSDGTALDEDDSSAASGTNGI